MAILPQGRRSRTDAFVITRLASMDLVRLELHSGRTHQIRVHLESIGHPVVGDPVYAAGGWKRIGGKGRLAGPETRRRWRPARRSMPRFWRSAIRSAERRCDSPRPGPWTSGRCWRPPRARVPWPAGRALSIPWGFSVPTADAPQGVDGLVVRVAGVRRYIPVTSVIEVLREAVSLESPARFRRSSGWSITGAGS